MQSRFKYSESTNFFFLGMVVFVKSDLNSSALPKLFPYLLFSIKGRWNQKRNTRKYLTLLAAILMACFVYLQFCAQAELDMQ